MLEKLLMLFKTNSVSQKTLGSISFTITKDDRMDIQCILPTITNANMHEIPSMAEKYANLLSAITMGELNDMLYNHIKEIAEKKESNNQILFVNNILSFWSIIYKEKQQNSISKFKSKYLPLIRPSQAFKS